MGHGISARDLAKCNVRLIRPKGRSPQVRFRDPKTGKEVRIPTGTHDEHACQTILEEIQAQLRLGIDPRTARNVRSQQELWENVLAKFIRNRQRKGNRTDIIEAKMGPVVRILKPNTIHDLADRQNLEDLRDKLAAGYGTHNGKLRPRKPATVNSTLRVVRSLLWYAHDELGLIDRPRRFGLSKDKAKSRPVTDAELSLILEAVPEVIPELHVEDWRRLLKGLRYTGLRLGEALSLSWDDRNAIHLVRYGDEVLIRFPAECQKNGKDETIPTIDEFAALVRDIPEDQRTGLVFRPHKRRAGGLMSLDQVKRTISEIGRKAGVFVSPEKPASAHDIRRAFGTELASAGIPVSDLKAMMRHSDVQTTLDFYVQSDAVDIARRVRSIRTVGRKQDAPQNPSPAESS